MATQVKFSIPEREIQNTGITFIRTVNGTRSGDLTIRQNHIVWRPAKNELVYKLSWDKLANFAENDGKKTRPKTTSVRAKKKLK